MQNIVRFLLMGLIGIFLSFARVSSVAAGGFTDNGDGTVTDGKRHLIWQKEDNGKEISFTEAMGYCATLQLGDYRDWRLPLPEEQDMAVAIELMMPLHTRDVHARFDLYWTINPDILIPFNYRPSRGAEVLRGYPAKQSDRAFARCVRSPGGNK